MTISERIAERMHALRITQSELARRVGVTQQSIGKLVKGQASSSAHMHKIARELETSVDYLMGETNDPTEGALPMPTPETVADMLDVVLVHEVDVAYGMGGTYIDRHVDSTPIPFPRTWLRMFTPADPKHLFFTRGDGDSMEPTIKDQDIVLIDTTEQAINRQDRVWAIAYGPIGSIKRVRAMPDGTYKIMSDNPNVLPEIASDGEMHVVGRVVAVIRKM